MDVSRYLEPRIAPRALFDDLDARRDRVRFVVPAADGGETRVTFGQFADDVRALSSYLLWTGFGPGDRGVIYAANRVEWMTAALAIQAVGGVMVPIYPSSTAEQAAYVIAHSDARVVFVDGAALIGRVASRWAAIDGVQRVVTLGSQAPGEDTPPELGKRWATFADAVALGRRRDGEDPSVFDRAMLGVSLDAHGLMLYTSGTSGNPKGVPLTHRNVAVNGADWLRCNAPLVEEGMVDLLWLPMSHIFGYGEACLGNTLGWTSTLADPMTVLDRLPVVRPQVFMSVPRVWEKLASAALAKADPEARRAALASATGGRLQFCLSGGAGLKREVKEVFHECGLLIIEGYGLTETSPTLTLNRPDAFRFDSVGKVLPSVEVKLAADGEILARGASVFSGYHKDAEATRSAFTDDGWFKTGDVGRWTEDGFLQIIDRKKDILVTAGGKNVPPANVEIRFDGDALVSHVVVYGDAKPYLVAGVWLADPKADPDALSTRALVKERIDRVNAEVASCETIKRFVIMRTPLTVEGGLLTPTLKVKRKQVYERFREVFEGLYA